MIIFDKEKYVKRIVKEGLQANTTKMRFKLSLVAIYYLQNTQYKPFQIKTILRNISMRYFMGLPEKIISDEIEDIFNFAKVKANKVESADTEEETDICENDDEASDCNIMNSDLVFERKKVIIYNEELERIKTLNNNNAENLSFIMLVIYKFFDYEWVYECNSDLYKLAELKVSGKSRNELLYLLSQNKMIRFNAFVNKDYKHNRHKKIAETKFKVLFCLDESCNIKTVAFTISDFDDLLLYYRYYIGDTDIIKCAGCDRPIRITGNAKKYCYECAIKSKQESNIRNQKVG